MKMAPPVLLVQKVLKFSPTERALIFATLKEKLSTAMMTNNAEFAKNLRKAVFFAMKMAPNVLNVMMTMIFGKGFVTLNALLMSGVKPKRNLTNACLVSMAVLNALMVPPVSPVILTIINWSVTLPVKKYATLVSTVNKSPPTIACLVS
jgi:hypothetical protein